MKKISTLLVLFLAINMSAQKDSEENLNIGLSLNHDAFFGFNPMMTLSFPTDKSGAITAYGIQWGAGTGSEWGQWTEVGIGYNFTVGNFNINPQLGFTMGNLLSSGAAQEGIIGDGIVPNLTVNYSSKKWESQFYFGYYGALINNTDSGESTNNYVHYWANLGYKVGNHISLGLHFEELYLSGGETNGGKNLERADGYVWLGPYIQLQKKNAGLRFSLGNNIGKTASFANNEFYKLTFFLSI
ncbi:DUF6733 family protein [Polaribacter tangerinus]|uniref:DUF6733 family protein n=1 Tax=Polaribacter tangerinus TaxID=1920034 RepID=UPI00117F98A2|nr:DUF6733 family protein [Polaribacter tangerinus]